MKATPRQKFNARTAVTDTCWLWTGSITPGGYAVFSPGVDRDRVLAHRWIYQQVKGDIPPGYQIDHLCRVRHCVNPDHLEAVTARENTLRSTNPPSLNARKTHCKRGHEFTSENTARSAAGRRCRACLAMLARKYYAAAKEQQT